MTFDRLIDFGTLTTLLGIALAWTAGAYVVFVLAEFARAALHRYAQRDLRPDEPRCKKCRYIVKHVTTPFCPECGASLKRGVLLPTPLAPMSPWVTALFLTLVFMPGPLLIGFYSLGRLIPACNRASCSVGSSDRALDGAIATGRLTRFTISVQASGRGNVIHFHAEYVLLIIPLGKDQYRDMEIQWQSRKYRQTDAWGVINLMEPAAPYNRERVVEFLRDYPSELLEDTAEVLADEVMALVETIAAGKQPDPSQYKRLRFGGHSASTVFDPPMPYVLAYLLGSGFTVLLSAALLTRRIAALRARSASAVTPSQPPVT